MKNIEANLKPGVGNERRFSFEVRGDEPFRYWASAFVHQITPNLGLRCKSTTRKGLLAFSIFPVILKWPRRGPRKLDAMSVMMMLMMIYDDNGVDVEVDVGDVDVDGFDDVDDDDDIDDDVVDDADDGGGGDDVDDDVLTHVRSESIRPSQRG